MALPLLSEDSQIIIEGNLESSSYVDMTIEILKTFGIIVNISLKGFMVPGRQKYTAPETFEVEGDWSNGGFLLGAAHLCGIDLTCSNLNLNSVQGDKKIIEIIDNFKNMTSGITYEIDASNIPDLIPAVAVIASVSPRETIIINAGRLRFKESDRLHSIATTLSSLGANITELSEGLIIQGVPKLTGGTVDSHSDHRIAMMVAMASIVTDHPIILTGSKTIDKSYPTFYKTLDTVIPLYNLILQN